MKYSLLLAVSILLHTGCGQKDNKRQNGEKEKKYSHFTGSYNKAFNDMHELHIESARRNGIGPLSSRKDTMLFAGHLKKIPDELVIFKTDPLKYSIPFLVPKAALLLTDICLNFRDSLINKKMPLYKPIITSITRTDDDVRKLARRNINASDNSAHRYGTTFDISWTRFDKMDFTDKRIRNDGQLKLVLAQVLFDLKQRSRCYVKHERKQACFHITVK